MAWRWPEIGPPSTEFGPFFDDPKRKRLSGRQLAYFAFHALVGYVLAFFVVAGLTGLTQAG